MTAEDKAAYEFKMSAMDHLVLTNPDRRSTLAHQRTSTKGLRPVFDEKLRRGTQPAKATSGLSQDASNINIEATEALLIKDEEDI